MKLIKIRKGNKTYKYEPQKKYVGNLLKPYLDLKKNANYLFYGYDGESINDLIEYSDTENVTDTNYMFCFCEKLQTIPQLDTSNVTDTSHMFHYCENLQTIPQLDTSNVTDTSYTFYYCENLQTIPQLNTSKVTDMSGMFYGCANLQTIPQLNTSNVTNMQYMFYGCHKLQTIPQLDTSNVTDMGCMFEFCNNLQTIPRLNTSKVADMERMFENCRNLQTIDITSLDKISSTSSMNYFAISCNSLTKFIIRNMTVIPPLNNNSFNNCYHFTGTVNSTYNPEGLKDARIYVPDNMVESLKTATNWSEFADIIVPLSTLSE